MVPLHVELDDFISFIPPTILIIANCKVQSSVDVCNWLYIYTLTFPFEQPINAVELYRIPELDAFL